jgi:hypothetical protein
MKSWLNLKLACQVMVIFCLYISIASAASVNTSPFLLAKQPLIGGCGAPVFFTESSQVGGQTLNNTKNIKRINIAYPPKLKPLASNIYTQLRRQVGSSAVIKMEQIDIQDTDTVKYRHDAVIVQQCFN